MATTSLIGIERKDGTIDYVYCYYDGYNERGVGETLYRHYTDEEKINLLVSMGDLGSLGETIEAPEEHNFSNMVDGCCLFYHRDREENWYKVKPKNMTSKKEIIPIVKRRVVDFAYLFSEGQWLVLETGKSFSQLKNYFR